MTGSLKLGLNQEVLLLTLKYFESIAKVWDGEPCVFNHLPLGFWVSLYNGLKIDKEAEEELLASWAALPNGCEEGLRRDILSRRAPSLLGDKKHFEHFLRDSMVYYYPAIGAIPVPKDRMEEVGIELPSGTPDFLPVCQECVYQGLFDETFVVSSCVRCGGSQWWQKKPNKEYPQGDIYFFDGCYFCIREKERPKLIYRDSVSRDVEKNPTTSSLCLDALSMVSGR